MLAAILLLFLVALAAFFATRRKSLRFRLVLAAVVLVAPAILLGTWVVQVGDHAAPGSTTVEVSPK